MIVGCPHCAARFELPEKLLGPRGARVLCPRCGGRFEVARERPGGFEERAGSGVLAMPTTPAIAPEIAMPALALSAELAAFPGPAVPPELATSPAPPAPAATGSGRVERAAWPARDPIARAALEGLAGAALAEAWAGGTLFAEHGTELLEVFDEYRRRAGSAADPARFRAALRERWGIDLVPEPPGRP